MEGQRDAVVLMERDRAESRSLQPLIDYILCHYLPAAQNFLATIWLLIEILRSLVNMQSTLYLRLRLLPEEVFHRIHISVTPAAQRQHAM